MKTIHIHISDCDDNETFEQIVEDAGLNRFGDDGLPKDNAETLTITGEITSENTNHSITFFRYGGLDDSTYSQILRIFNLPLETPSITIKIDTVNLS